MVPLTEKGTFGRIQVGNSSNTAEVGFFIAVTVAIFITLVLIIALITYMKGLYSLHRSLLLVQMIICDSM